MLKASLGRTRFSHPAPGQASRVPPTLSSRQSTTPSALLQPFIARRLKHDYTNSAPLGAADASRSSPAVRAPSADKPKVCTTGPSPSLSWVFLLHTPAHTTIMSPSGTSATKAAKELLKLVRPGPTAYVLDKAQAFTFYRSQDSLVMEACEDWKKALRCAFPASTAQLKLSNLQSWLTEKHKVFQEALTANRALHFDILLAVVSQYYV